MGQAKRLAQLSVQVKTWLDYWTRLEFLATEVLDHHGNLWQVKFSVVCGSVNRCVKLCKCKSLYTYIYMCLSVNEVQNTYPAMYKRKHWPCKYKCEKRVTLGFSFLQVF
jgi:hypothetical protein